MERVVIIAVLTFVLAGMFGPQGASGFRAAPRTQGFGAAILRQPGMMRILNFAGRVQAADKMNCKNLHDTYGMDVPLFTPSQCMGRCPRFLPRYNTCRQVGSVGFCCNPLITDQMINALGYQRTMKMLF